MVRYRVSIAVEEERKNKIRPTNKRPINGIFTILLTKTLLSASPSRLICLNGAIKSWKNKMNHRSTHFELLTCDGTPQNNATEKILLR